MYKFQREDNGVIVEVPFEKMMEKVAGVITLDDGVTAREAATVATSLGKFPSQRELNKQTPPSDSLGCIAQQVESKREYARRHGLAVEFTPDPRCKGFYQARFPSEKARQDYCRALEVSDNNRTGTGAGLSEGQLRAAERKAKEMYA